MSDKPNTHSHPPHPRDLPRAPVSVPANNIPQHLTRAALALILAAPLVRVLQLTQRTLYWDDFIIPSFFNDFSPLAPSTWGVLLTSYDGHLMPASALLQLAVHRLAPLQWWLPALIIVGATAACGWLWWRVAVALRGPHISAVAVLAFLVFSPFLMAAAGWWSTATNAFAWQAGMAGVLLVLFGPTHSHRPSRTPHRPSHPDTPLRVAFLSALISLGALLFTEKALSIFPAAVVIALLAGLPRRRLVALAGPGIVWASWLALYLALSTLPESDNPRAITGAIPGAIAKALLPGAAGGPLTWERWQPGTAFAATPVAWSVVSCVTLAILALAWARLDLRRLAALAAIIAYAVAILLSLVTARAGMESSGVLTLNFHYYADWFTFAVLAIAAPPARRHPTLSTHTLLVGTAAFVLVSVVSTTTWALTWRDDPTRDYITTLRTTLRNDETPLLDQVVPLEILLPVTEPHNHIGAITGTTFPRAIPQPRMIGDSGRIVEARILGVASNGEGEEPACGTRIATGHTHVFRLERALPFGEWTWQLNASATVPVRVRISTPNGLETQAESDARATTVPVGTEPSAQWVRVSGGGGLLALSVQGPKGASVCVGRGEIGQLVPAEDNY